MQTQNMRPNLIHSKEGGGGTEAELGIFFFIVDVQALMFQYTVCHQVVSQIL